MFRELTKENLMKKNSPLKLSELPYFNDYEVLRDGKFETPSLRGLQDRAVIICAFGNFDLKKLERAQGVSCVIADEKMVQNVSEEFGLVLASDPMECLIGLHLHLYQSGFYDFTQTTAIDETATIHPSCWIDEIGVVVGPGTEIGANSVILSGTKIGKNVIIGSNVTIGSPGFEVRQFKGELINLPHVGGVELGNNCEIQSNSSVAKAIFDDATVIGKTSTLAHNCFVSHGSKIGKRVKIAPGAIVCGGVTIGDDVWIGPNATVSNALSVGNGAFISIGCTLVESLADGERAYAQFAKIRKV